MRLFGPVILTVLAGVVAAPSLGAQGLAGAAEREKERRARQKGGATTKSYGDGDLSASPAEPVKPTPSPSRSPDVKKPPAGVSVAVPDSDAERAKEESYWRDRARQVRSAAVNAEAAIKIAEMAIAGTLPTMARDGHCVFTILDGPSDGIGNCEQIEAARPARARAALPRFRQEAERARQALEEFQAAALRAGIPYDWIR